MHRGRKIDVNCCFIQADVYKQVQKERHVSFICKNLWKSTRVDLEVLNPLSETYNLYSKENLINMQCM